MFETTLEEKEKRKLYDLLYKNGLIVDILAHVRLDNRYYFNTWQINGFMNSHDKSDLNESIVGVFDFIFERGVRLWNWRKDEMDSYDDNQFVLENLEMSIVEDNE